jgi:hypothetical protein
VLWFFLLFDALILLVAGGHLLIGAPFGTIDLLFSLEGEPTIPSWYASVKLLLVACLLAALSVSVGKDLTKRRTLLGAAFLFVVMSCDEAAAVHERLQGMIGNRMPAAVNENIYDGVVLAKVLVGLAALAVAAFVVLTVIRTLRHVGKGGTTFGAGFLLLAMGAVGVDLTDEFLPLTETGAALWMFLEEIFEMVGVTLMIVAVLQALACAPVTLDLGARLRSRAAKSSE